MGKDNLSQFWKRQRANKQEGDEDKKDNKKKKNIRKSNKRKIDTTPNNKTGRKSSSTIQAKKARIIGKTRNSSSKSSSKRKDRSTTTTTALEENGGSLKRRRSKRKKGAALDDEEQLELQYACDMWPDSYFNFHSGIVSSTIGVNQRSKLMKEYIDKRYKNCSFHLSENFVYKEIMENVKDAHHHQSKIHQSIVNIVRGEGTVRVKEKYKLLYRKLHSYFFEIPAHKWGVRDQVQLADLFLRFQNKTKTHLDVETVLDNIYKNNCFSKIFELKEYKELKKSYETACETKSNRIRSELVVTVLNHPKLFNIWRYSKFSKAVSAFHLSKKDKRRKKNRQHIEMKIEAKLTEQLPRMYSKEDARAALKHMMSAANSYCEEKLAATPFTFDLDELKDRMSKCSPHYYYHNYMAWVSQDNEQGQGDASQKRTIKEKAALLHLIALGITQSRQNAPEFTKLWSALNVTISMSNDACMVYRHLGFGTGKSNSKQIVDELVGLHDAIIRPNTHEIQDNAQQRLEQNDETKFAKGAISANRNLSKPTGPRNYDDYKENLLTPDDFQQKQNDDLYKVTPARKEVIKMNYIAVVENILHNVFALDKRKLARGSTQTDEPWLPKIKAQLTPRIFDKVKAIIEEEEKLKNEMKKRKKKERSERRNAEYKKDAERVVKEKVSNEQNNDQRQKLQQLQVAELVDDASGADDDASDDIASDNEAVPINNFNVAVDVESSDEDDESSDSEDEGDSSTASNSNSSSTTSHTSSNTNSTNANAYKSHIDEVNKAFKQHATKYLFEKEVHNYTHFMPYDCDTTAGMEQIMHDMFKRMEPSLLLTEGYYSALLTGDEKYARMFMSCKKMFGEAGMDPDNIYARQLWNRLEAFCILFGQLHMQINKLAEIYKYCWPTILQPMAFIFKKSSLNSEASKNFNDSRDHANIVFHGVVLSLLKKIKLPDCESVHDIATKIVDVVQEEMEEIDVRKDFVADESDIGKDQLLFADQMLLINSFNAAVKNNDYNLFDAVYPVLLWQAKASGATHYANAYAHTLEQYLLLSKMAKEWVQYLQRPKTARGCHTEDDWYAENENKNVKATTCRTEKQFEKAVNAQKIVRPLRESLSTSWVSYHHVGHSSNISKARYGKQLLGALMFAVNGDGVDAWDRAFKVVKTMDEVKKKESKNDVEKEAEDLYKKNFGDEPDEANVYYFADNDEDDEEEEGVEDDADADADADANAVNATKSDLTKSDFFTKHDQRRNPYNQKVAFISKKYFDQGYPKNLKRMHLIGDLKLAVPKECGGLDVSEVMEQEEQKRMKKFQDFKKRRHYRYSDYYNLKKRLQELIQQDNNGGMYKPNGIAKPTWKEGQDSQEVQLKAKTVRVTYGEQNHGTRNNTNNERIDAWNEFIQYLVKKQNNGKDNMNTVEIRKHQREAAESMYNKTNYIHTAGPGTGKTMPILASMLVRQTCGAVIVPFQTLKNELIEKASSVGIGVTDDLDTYIKKRKEYYNGDQSGYPILLVCNPETIAADSKNFKERAVEKLFDFVVIDEGHMFLTKDGLTYRKKAYTMVNYFMNIAGKHGATLAVLSATLPTVHIDKIRSDFFDSQMNNCEHVKGPFRADLLPKIFVKSHSKATIEALIKDAATTNKKVVLFHHKSIPSAYTLRNHLLDKNIVPENQRNCIIVGSRLVAKSHIKDFNEAKNKFMLIIATQALSNGIALHADTIIVDGVTDIAQLYQMIGRSTRSKTESEAYLFFSSSLAPLGRLATSADVSHSAIAKGTIACASLFQEKRCFVKLLRDYFGYNDGVDKGRCCNHCKDANQGWKGETLSENDRRLIHDALMNVLHENDKKKHKQQYTATVKAWRENLNTICRYNVKFSTNNTSKNYMKPEDIKRSSSTGTEDTNNTYKEGDTVQAIQRYGKYEEAIITKVIQFQNGRTGATLANINNLVWRMARSHYIGIENTLVQKTRKKVKVLSHASNIGDFTRDDNDFGEDSFGRFLK